MLIFVLDQDNHSFVKLFSDIWYNLNFNILVKILDDILMDGCALGLENRSFRINNVFSVFVDNSQRNRLYAFLCENMLYFKEHNALCFIYALFYKNKA